MAEPEVTIWTSWLDYYATGEGRSMMAYIGYATDEARARQQFAEAFGEYFGRGCEVQRGVVRNELTNLLWSEQTLNMFEEINKRGALEAKANVHFNFS